MTSPEEQTRDFFDTGSRGVRHRGLRRANEKAVLTVVAFNPGVSNAEISRLSGLAPQTVSAILAALEQNGLIERGPVLRGRRGQPATPIIIRAAGAYAIGVELSWTHADVILLDMHAQVLGHKHIDYPYPDAGTLIDRIAELARELRELLPQDDRKRLLDLGVALPGGLRDKLYLVDAPEEQTALWQNIDLAAELALRTGLEVSLINDGNAACWAELIMLPRPRPANIIYFLVNRYVAAGIIGDGVLWEGPTGNAADLGSMLVQFDESGPREAHFVASVAALERMRRDANDADVTEQWLEQCSRTLARVTFNAMTVVESPLLIIDSILGAPVTERLAQAIEQELAALPVRNFRPPRVIPGTYGRMGPAVGAAEFPLYRRYL